jgi:hypothetical protein
MALALSGHSHHDVAEQWLDSQASVSSIFSAGQRNRLWFGY